MSKNKKLHAVPPTPAARPSAAITQEYSQLCAEVGNAVFNFEILKSNALAKFQKLQNEMIEATKKEEADKAKQDELAKQVMQQVADKVVGETK